MKNRFNEEYVGLEDTRQRTGGEHGDVYTKTFPIEDTLHAAFSELASRFGARKLTRTQRFYLRVATAFIELGITKDDLTESLQKTNLHIYEQLTLFFAVKSESLASINAFHTKWELGTMSGHCQRSRIRHVIAQSKE